MKRKALALACAMVMAMSMCVTAVAQESKAEIPSEVTPSGVSETSAENSAAAEQKPATNAEQGNDNLPLFLIAGCAITGFVVVAIVCKKKGRNR